MSKPLENSNEDAATPSPPGKPASWAATLAGIFPFILIGFCETLMESPTDWALHTAFRDVGSALLMGGPLVILIGVGIGWAKGFPRWVYPYIVYGVLSAFALSHASTPGRRIFGYETFGRETWGWRAWVI